MRPVRLFLRKKGDKLLMPSVYLHLQNGQVLKGHGFGAAVDAVGELVFQTSVVGYQETFTDPAYYGQIVVQTFPLLGNYGAIPADDLSACHPAGVVCREVCGAPSNFRCEETLPAWMEKQGMAGISGIDTRALTALESARLHRHQSVLQTQKARRTGVLPVCRLVRTGPRAAGVPADGQPAHFRL